MASENTMTTSFSKSERRLVSAYDAFLLHMMIQPQTMCVLASMHIISLAMVRSAFSCVRFAAVRCHEDTSE